MGSVDVRVGCLMGAVPWPPFYELAAPPGEQGQTPAAAAGVCPNCLTDLDMDAYCSGCGRVFPLGLRIPPEASA